MNRNCMCYHRLLGDAFFYLDLALMWPSSNIFQVIFHICIGQLVGAWWNCVCPSQGLCHVLETHQFLSTEGYWLTEKSPWLWQGFYYHAVYAEAQVIHFLACQNLV